MLNFGIVLMSNVVYTYRRLGLNTARSVGRDLAQSTRTESSTLKRGHTTVPWPARFQDDGWRVIRT